jgi:ribA/ribD-fused uncharacterized protein
MKLRHHLEKAVTSFRGPNVFLSNFYPSPISLPEFANEHGLFWAIEEAPTVEHAYQAYKAVRREDFDKILRAKKPAEAKKLGRQVEKIDGWDSFKEDIMLRLLQAKFSQHSRLRDRLVVTGDRMLIEGNGWGDRYWGVCNGRGKNRLGILLMQVRQEIREHGYQSFRRDLGEV